MTYGDYGLKPDEKWQMLDRSDVGKVSKNEGKKPGRLVRFARWVKGTTSDRVILAVLSKKLGSITISKCSERATVEDAKAAVQIGKDVAQRSKDYYSKTNVVTRFFDRILHGKSVKKSVKGVTEKTEKDLRGHLFPSPSDTPLSLGQMHHMIDTLTSGKPSPEDFKEVEKNIMRAYPGDKSAVVITYARLANLGYPGAQYRLAQSFEEGAGGLAKDNALACKHYKEAGYAGVAPAQLRLEKAHRLGELGLTKDLKEAHAWACKASGKSDQAWLQMAKNFASGSGTEQDLTKATLHFQDIVSTSEEPRIKAQAHYELGTITASQGFSEHRRVISQDDLLIAKAHFENALSGGVSAAKQSLERVQLQLLLRSTDPASTFTAAEYLEKGVGAPVDLKRAQSLYLAVGATDVDETNTELKQSKADALYRGGVLALSQDRSAGMDILYKAVDAGSEDAGALLLRMGRDNPAQGAKAIRKFAGLRLGHQQFIGQEAEKARNGTLTPELAGKTISFIQRRQIMQSIIPNLNTHFNSSEEKKVQSAFNALTPAQQQSLRDFVDISKRHGDNPNTLVLATRALFGTDKVSGPQISKSGAQIGILEVLISGKGMVLIDPMAPVELDIQDPKLQKAWKVMDRCMRGVNELLKNPEMHEGIYRLSASQTYVDEFMKIYDKPGVTDEEIEKALEQKDVPHFLAAIHKRLLRDNPLISNNSYGSFTAIGQRLMIAGADEQAAIDDLRDAIQKLPPDRRLILEQTIPFFADVATREGTDKEPGTKMGPVQLATCFAPNIFRSADVTEEMTNVGATNKLAMFMMTHHRTLFSQPSG